MSAHPGPSFLLRTLFFLPYSALLGRPYRPAVRTPPFHGGNTGSNPVRVAKRATPSKPASAEDPQPVTGGLHRIKATAVLVAFCHFLRSSWPTWPVLPLLRIPVRTEEFAERDQFLGLRRDRRPKPGRTCQRNRQHHQKHKCPGKSCYLLATPVHATKGARAGKRPGPTKKLFVIGMLDIRSDRCISRDTMHVSKWGNSLAIRLPAAVVEILALKEGDEIEITVTDSRVFKVSRKASRAELLERLHAFRGRLPLDFKFDRDEANAR